MRTLYLIPLLVPAIVNAQPAPPIDVDVHVDVRVNVAAPPDLAPAAPLTDERLGSPKGISIDGAEPALPADRQVAVSGVVQAFREEAYGVRTELDLAAQDGWIFGVAGELGTSRMFVDEYARIPGRSTSVYVYDGFELHDQKAVIYLAHSIRRGRLDLRGGFGAGALRTSVRQWGYDGTSEYMDRTTATQVTPVLETSTMLSIHLTRNLAFGIGGIATLCRQEGLEPIVHIWHPTRNVDLAFQSGFRWSL